jgi:hypothetical protein
MKQKAGSFETINKIDRTLVHTTKMRKQETQISKISNVKGEITTNTTEIIRDYSEGIYSNKFENFEEMDRFLDTYNHPKVNKEDINHLNRPITENEIEAAIQSLPKKKTPGPDRFTAEFNQTFKEEIVSTFLKVFHEIEREGTLPNLFYEGILF